MAVDVTSETVIRRPVHEVAAFASDPDNAPAWYVNIRAMEWKTKPPMVVGSRIAFVARFLGKQLKYVYEVIEFVPHSRLVMRTSDGPFPMETSYEWVAAEGAATRMILRNRGIPAGFSILLSPFMSLAIRRANRQDLKRLKSLLED